MENTKQEVDYKPTYISDHVKKIFKKRKVTVNKGKRRGDKRVKYTRKQLQFTKGFDLLENFYVVRYYIQRKHDIPQTILEILLNLYPKNYFTRRDFSYALRDRRMHSYRYMVDHGFFEVVVMDRKGERNRYSSVYKLTAKSQYIVTSFYKLLSGEMKFPEDLKNNPLMSKRLVCYQDQIVAKAILRLNGQEPSETKKEFH